MNRVIIGIATILFIVGGLFLVSRIITQIRESQVSQGQVSGANFSPLPSYEPIPSYEPPVTSNPQAVSSPLASPVGQFSASPTPVVGQDGQLPATGL